MRKFHNKVKRKRSKTNRQKMSRVQNMADTKRRACAALREAEKGVHDWPPQ